MTTSADVPELQAQVTTLQQQLATLEQQQELMLYTLSHDLRAPIMTMLGFADLLLADIREATAQTPAKQYLEHIRSAARRQLTLVEGLLKLSQLRRRELQTSPTDLSALAKTCLESLLPPLTSSKYIVQIHPTPPVECDAQLLNLALNELLANAVKFTRNVAAPTITFGSERQQTQLVMYVRDNGIGFEPHRANRLFQSFMRLHSPQEYEGAGIGLTAVATIIQRHGGRIWVDSQPNHGATFYFTLQNN